MMARSDTIAKEDTMKAIRLLMLTLAFGTSPGIALAAPGFDIHVALSGTNYRPVAFNNAGDIAFQDISANLTEAHANVLYADGTRVNLTLPGASVSYVNAINERGQAVGWSFACCDTSGNVAHPVLLDHGQVTQLDANGGRLRTAYAINNAGHIAGEFVNDADRMRAVVYDGTNYRDLSDGGGAISTAMYINDRDQVAGVIAPIGNEVHAFLYSDGVMTDLSAVSGYPNSSAWGINEMGQVIGRSGAPLTDYPERGFLYYQGQFTDLTPSSLSQPMAINNKGQVVGDLGIGIGDPFVWENGAYARLNDLIDPASGYVLQVAADINDNGQILAWACNRQDAGACDVLVLSPVPESPACLMLAGGLAFVVLRSRRPGCMATALAH
jgi:probable HAF family extracellular repeat protein